MTVLTNQGGNIGKVEWVKVELKKRDQESILLNKDRNSDIVQR